jgi:pimeloyl-ACP methyl ester carboxylesterase
MAARIIFSHGNSFPASTYRVIFENLRQRGFVVDAIEKFGHDPRYPVTNNWPHLVQQLADFAREKQRQYDTGRGTNVTVSEARQSLDRFVPRDDGIHQSPVTASEARQSLDRFVPRDDGVHQSPVTASEARQSSLSDPAMGEPAFLVGHSLGGILSLMCAARHPELARGVVLIDSPVLGGWRATTLGLAKRTPLIGALSPGRISQKRRNHWPSIEAALDNFQHKKSFAHWDPQVLRDYIAHGTRDENGQRVLSFDRDIETAIYNSLPHKLDSLLKRKPLKCPAAFIGGTHSAEMRQAGTDLTHQVVKGRIMMLDGSHLFPMEKPIATAAAIEATLRNFGL